MHRRILENIEEFKDLNIKLMRLIDDMSDIHVNYRSRQGKNDDRYPERSGICYSYLAARPGLDTEEDYWNYLSALELRGWNIRDINSIFNTLGYDYICKLTSKMDYDHKIQLMDGITDIFLYKLTKGVHVLGGYDMKEDLDASYDYRHDMAIIKYQYGWHKSAYGRLAFEQALGSDWKNEFKKRVLIGTKNQIIEYSNFTSIVRDEIKFNLRQSREYRDIPIRELDNKIKEDIIKICNEGIEVNDDFIEIDGKKIDEELSKYIDASGIPYLTDTFDSKSDIYDPYYQRHYELVINDDKVRITPLI